MISHAFKFIVAGAIAIGFAIILKTEISPSAIQAVSDIVRGDYKYYSATGITNIALSAVGRNSRESQLVPFQNCSFEEGGGSPSFSGAVFHEVAWMGDRESYTNEWISLRLSGNEEVNIAGWQVLNQNEKLRAVIPQGTALHKAAPRYVLARNADIAGVDADATFSGAIRNEKEGLRLFDNECNLIDEVFADPQWPGGDNETKHAMTRAPDLSWGTGGAQEKVRSQEDPDILEEVEEKDFGELDSDPYVPEEMGSADEHITITEPEAPSPSLALVYPPEVNAGMEFAVRLSAEHLAFGTYDIKISLSSDGMTNMSDIYNDVQGSWQSSFYYLRDYVTGESFTHEFRLRVREAYQEFSGPAAISVRLRESGKSNYIEYVGSLALVGAAPVSSQSATGGGGTVEEAGGQKININTADYEELQKITGVGPTIAGRIIEYRNEYGSFQKIEDIKNVKGIGDATFEKMKDEITT